MFRKHINIETPRSSPAARSRNVDTKYQIPESSKTNTTPLPAKKRVDSMFPSLTNGDIVYSDTSFTEVTSGSEEGPRGNRKTSEGKNGDSEDGGDDDDESDIEWVDVFQATIESTPTTHVHHSLEVKGDLQLTLDKKRAEISIDKKKGVSARERQIRVGTHCLHVQFLLFHGAVRNRWLCDPELHAILLSQLTPSIMKDIERFQLAQGKKSIKAVAKGATDPILKLLGVLIHWWKKKFAIDKNGMRKHGYKTLQQLEGEKNEGEKFEFMNGNKGLNREVGCSFRCQGEKVENLVEFRKLATQCRGSRDIGAMLFTGLLRAIGLKARMVFSLQPLGFGFTERENFTESEQVKNKGQLESARSKCHSKGRVEGKYITEFGEESEDDKDYGNDTSGGFVRESPTLNLYHKPRRPTYDKDLSYPIFWSEVYSPTSDMWITVESLVLTIFGSSPDLLARFEPKGKKVAESKQVIAYVIAYSDNGTAKDVTVRYLTKNNFPGKTKGFRIPITAIPIYDYEGNFVASHSRDWFSGVMRGYQMPEHLRTERDTGEDKELQGLVTSKLEEAIVGKKESINYYKNSSEYVLERHLKREEAVRLGKSHIKTFTVGKGEKAKEEKVYSKEDIVVCKSVENWYREGRIVNEGQQPLKRVKPRATTLNRKLEIEEAQKEGDTVMQGLYSEEQTKLYNPPPIVDGKIPRNAFGNIDIYVSSMIPPGAVHLPLKGSAKLAKRLGIDCAEAVTGFEFKKQRAAPTVEGIIIAAGNEDLLRDAWRAEEEEKKKRVCGKREKAALGMWRRFLMGLRIVKYLRDEYADMEEDGTLDVNPFTAKKLRQAKQKQSYQEGGGKMDEADNNEVEEGGGFFKEGEDKEVGGGFIREGGSDVDERGGSLDDEEETTNGSGSEMILDGDESTASREDGGFILPALQSGVMSLRDMMAHKRKRSSAETAGSDSGEEPQRSTASSEIRSEYFMGNKTASIVNREDAKSKAYLGEGNELLGSSSGAGDVEARPRMRIEIQIPINRVMLGQEPRALVFDEAPSTKVQSNGGTRRAPKRKAAAQAESSKYFTSEQGEEGEEEDFGGKRGYRRRKRGKIAR